MFFSFRPWNLAGSALLGGTLMSWKDFWQKPFLRSPEAFWRLPEAAQKVKFESGRKYGLRSDSSFTFWAASGGLQSPFGGCPRPFRRWNLSLVKSMASDQIQVSPSGQPQVASRRPLGASRWPLNGWKGLYGCPLGLVSPWLSKWGVTSQPFEWIQISPSEQPRVASRRPLVASRWLLDGWNGL